MSVVLADAGQVAVNADAAAWVRRSRKLEITNVPNGGSRNDSSGSLKGCHCIVGNVAAVFFDGTF